MKMLMKVGKFFRFIDNNNQLSITNIALMVVLIKLSLSPTTSLTETGTLLIALGNYAHKKRMDNNNVKSK